MTSSFQPVQYQKYARPEGFDPIQTTDIAPNMAREQANVQRDMRTQNLSEQNNYKTRAFNEQIQQAGLNKLAQFSETLTQTLVENQKKVNEREKLRGLNEAFVNGVPEDIQNAFNQQREQVNTEGLAGQRILNDNVDNGNIPWRLARKMDSMSPHMQLGYAQGILQQLGRSYTGDAITGLQEAIAQNPMATDAERAAMLQNFRTNWFQKTGLSEFNPALLNSELFPSMRRAEAQILANWTNQEVKAINDRSIEDANALLNGGVYTQNQWEVASELYRSAGYNRSQARQAMLSSLTPESLEQWALVPSFDGKTPLGQKYLNDFTQARLNNLNKAATWEAGRDRANALQARTYADPFINLWTGEGARQPSAAEIEAVKQRSLKEFGTYDRRLNRFANSTVDAFQEKSWRKTLDGMIKDGTLTEEWLRAQQGIPDNVLKDYIGPARQLGQGRNPDGKDPNVTQLEDDIRVGYQETDRKFDVIIPGSRIAAARAKADYLRKRAAYIAGGVDPINAGKQAYNDVLKEIKLGRGTYNNASQRYEGGSGLYKVTPAKGYENILGDTQARSQAAQAALARKTQIDRTFAQGRQRKIDPKVIVQDYVLVDKDFMKQAVNGIGTPNFTVPPIFTYISQQTGYTMTPDAIMRAQYFLHFGQQLPASAASQAEEQLSPEFIEMLNNVPSPKRVMRPFLQMTGVQPKGQPYLAPAGVQTGDWVGGDPPAGYNPDGSRQGQGGPEEGQEQPRPFMPELIPNNYGTTVQQAAINTGLDPAILAGLIETETNWDADNQQPDGKEGIGNLDPEIGKEYGYKPDDAEAQINASAQYLSYLLGVFEGNMNLALYAYKDGPDAAMSSSGSQYADDVLTRSSKYGYKSEFPPGMNRALKKKLMSQKYGI